MAGHSHWKQIKHHKGAADEKRSALFSKLLRAIAVAAQTEPNPDFNPTLRTAVEKARAANIPNENIARAIARSGKGDEILETITIEAYGPEGVALLIDAATDNKNRTVMEIKTLLKNHGAKWAEPGSVRWAFSGGVATFTQSLTPETREALARLVAALESHADILNVTTNAS